MRRGGMRRILCRGEGGGVYNAEEIYINETQCCDSYPTLPYLLMSIHFFNVRFTALENSFSQ